MEKQVIEVEDKGEKKKKGENWMIVQPRDLGSHLYEIILLRGCLDNCII